MLLGNKFSLSLYLDRNTNTHYSSFTAKEDTHFDTNLGIKRGCNSCCMKISDLYSLAIPPPIPSCSYQHTYLTHYLALNAMHYCAYFIKSSCLESWYFICDLTTGSWCPSVAFDLCALRAYTQTVVKKDCSYMAAFWVLQVDEVVQHIYAMTITLLKMVCCGTHEILHTSMLKTYRHDNLWSVTMATFDVQSDTLSVLNLMCPTTHHF